MKIVVDENIPQALEAFGNFGEIILSSGRKISNKLLSDADILIVRSITIVNEDLLKRTKVKFVGTATAGTDHIDIEFLNKNKIAFADAAGCNSYSVAEYFISALVQLYKKNNVSLKNKTLGVVGCGNVGSKVARFSKELGLEVLINDPPLERKYGSKDFVTIEEILKCDIISLHVPLNLTGIDKTFHLINEENLKQIKSGTILINTSRGEVIENYALKKRLINYADLITVLDVWENEPLIDYELLSKVDIGTAHIAGYSLEGKVNGTEIIYKKLCNFLNVPSSWQPKYPSIPESVITIDTNKKFEEHFYNIFKEIYKIDDDDKLLREGINFDSELQSKHFDLLRKNYSIRREFNNYSIKLTADNEELKRKFETLRFKVI